MVWRKAQKSQRGEGLEISNRTVNLEAGLLRRVLKRAKRLHVIADDLRPLPVRQNVGRALTADEKLRLIGTAAQKLEWGNARLAMMLALNTTTRACEIRGLRWRDVNLIDRALSVEQSKTQAGERVIPLNGDELSPDWYVFTHAEDHTKPDPAQPMSGWGTAWRKLRSAAAKGDEKKGMAPMPSLARLRFHDLRHHAITALAESLASDQTIMSIAGHVSPRMLAHYSHVRLGARRHALDALATKRPDVPVPGVSPESRGTPDVTFRGSEAVLEV